MPFLYPFLNFLQPGDLWPALVPFRPMLVASIAIGLCALRPDQRLDPELARAYFKHPTFLWICVFVLIQVMSVYYSGVLSMIEEFDSWEVYPLFVAISLLTIREAGDLRRYIWGAMAGSAYVVFYGIHAVLVHSPTLAGGRAGAYGMYENHNDYTFIIVMILPFAWFYLRLCRRRWQQIFLVALMIGCVSGVILSLSRGGILALVLEVALLLALTLRGERRIAALFVLGLVGTTVISYQFAAREANQGATYTEEDSEYERFELWRIARAMIVAHPILGVGSGRFREFAPEYGELSHDDRGKNAHNTYLEIAADTGLTGIGCFILTLGGSLKSLRGTRLTDAIGDGVVETRLAALVSLCTTIFRALLDVKEGDWSFYFLAIVAIASSALDARTKCRAPEPSTPASFPVHVLTSARPMIYRRR